MRRINFRPSRITDPPKRRWLARWLVRARRATFEVIATVDRGEPIAFRSEVWSELKGFLLEHVFNGKCAYCESRVTTTDFGDAEHYRPKAGITHQVNGKRAFVISNGRRHPGYYWLAYDWRNILPACAQCNSGSGKLNQFPIEASCQYVDSPAEGRYPAALDEKEKPCLLHPYFHEPERYLRFGEDGIVAPMSDDVRGLGVASIATYHLDRDGLATTRKEYQERAWGEFLRSMTNDTPIAAAMAKYKNGEAPYSLACLHYVQLKFIQKQNEFHEGL
jgi:hypothetical protein